VTALRHGAQRHVDTLYGSSRATVNTQAPPFTS